MNGLADYLYTNYLLGKQQYPLRPDLIREDGTPKGAGFLGSLPHKGGGYSTEISIDVDGQSMPTLVPTLTTEEIAHLLSGGKPTASIVEKAIKHSQYRQSYGKSPFLESGEIMPPLKNYLLGNE